MQRQRSKVVATSQAFPKIFQPISRISIDKKVTQAYNAAQCVASSCRGNAARRLSNLNFLARSVDHFQSFRLLPAVIASPAVQACHKLYSTSFGSENCMRSTSRRRLSHFWQINLTALLCFGLLTLPLGSLRPARAAAPALHPLNYAPANAPGFF